MCLLLALAQTSTPEPSPQGWASTGEKIVGLAHSQPEAFWPIVAVSLPLLTVAGVVLLVVKWLLPAWRTEKAADREALVAALRQRGEEAERDAAKDRELAKAQSEALVGRIETKVDRITGEIAKLDGRVERHSEVLARLSLKVGAGVALLCAFLGGVAAGAGAFALAERPAQPTQQQQVQTQTAADDDTARGECVRKPCAANQRCCGPERCCEIKSGTAEEPALVPLSALAFSDLDCAAFDTSCDTRVSLCD